MDVVSKDVEEKLRDGDAKVCKLNFFCINVYLALWEINDDAREYRWQVSENVDFDWKKPLQKKTEEIVGIHPSSAEEFVTMRSVTRRIAAAGKPKTNL
ncbi:hypothetical protein Tco_0158233 [Tanacetum coccineum]